MVKPISKTIKGIILAMSFLTLFYDVSGQGIEIKVEKLKSPLRENFYFKIINSSNLNLFYTVAMEICKDGEGWSEIRSDVFNYTGSKKTRILKINAKDEAKRYFNPQRLIRGSFTTIKYRFKVGYGKEIERQDLVTYSEPFVFY